ncbi:hypothetical protein HMPREF2682_07870 [Rothia sp. HMSC061D12]|nr:hypothetical protein HMPREF2682_07870 [Rothia sp. HMSC061D12]
MNGLLIRTSNQKSNKKKGKLLSITSVLIFVLPMNLRQAKLLPEKGKFEKQYLMKFPFELKKIHRKTKQTGAIYYLSFKEHYFSTN